MSKRRINKQQLARIEKNQLAYQEKENDCNLVHGLVITSFNKYVEIEDLQGKRIKCSLRPHLDILVAGDQVIWQKEGKGQGVIVSLCPRRSVLARSTATGFSKPVAANVTQMIIVVASEPEVSWPLLDSYLIIAELLKLQSIIILNKIDLSCQEIKQRLITDYQSLHYPVLTFKQQCSLSIEALKKVLDKQVSVFVGQSGVGKSSIISAITPQEESIAVNEISNHSKLGKHTTSNSRYYHLPKGGALIDSPGVREFNLDKSKLNKAEIAQGYIEFRPYLSYCKFRNCTHINTPYCALIAALEKGLISQRRYENFIKLSYNFSNK